MDYQTLLVEHLELIDRVVQFVGRRHHVSADDAEEFASVVRYKLIDRDFAILRKFQGRSNLSTYLTTVIERLYLDFCISRWGKWRPSASARRLGAVAILLERMIARSGMTFDEAVGTLQTNHGVTHSREALHALLVQLPVRPVRRFAGEEELALASVRAGVADAAFEQSDDQALVERVEAALTNALATLPHQDQLILKMRFQDAVAVPQIAKALGIEAKPLYRRLEQSIRLLRAELDKEGLAYRQIEPILGHPALVLGHVLKDLPKVTAEIADLRPSKG